MKRIRLLKLCLVIGVSLTLSHCGKFVEKDAETLLDIVGQQNGNQIPDGNGAPDIGDNTGDNPTDPTEPQDPNDPTEPENPTPEPDPTEPTSNLDCSPLTVSAVQGSYDDFAVWMPFSIGTNQLAGQITDTVKLKANASGTYEIYVPAWGSGASELNESFYATVTNSSNPTGNPTEELNCNNKYMVKDIDNEAPLPDGKRVFIGRFYLKQGPNNTLKINHYCNYFAQHHTESGFLTSQCASFHYGFDDQSTFASSIFDPNLTGCLSGKANSVVINASGLCVRKIIP
ncbi:MAG: hypothetical protein KDD48_07525 [Bdellovibrionales bacterium]|nr:hypothetical protein [Bdellovibrionales bacterium]